MSPNPNVPWWASSQSPSPLVPPAYHPGYPSGITAAPLPVAIPRPFPSVGPDYYPARPVYPPAPIVPFDPVPAPPIGRPTGTAPSGGEADKGSYQQMKSWWLGKSSVQKGMIAGGAVAAAAAAFYLLKGSKMTPNAMVGGSTPPSWRSGSGDRGRLVDSASDGEIVISHGAKRNKRKGGGWLPAVHVKSSDGGGRNMMSTWSAGGYTHEQAKNIAAREAKEEALRYVSGDWVVQMVPMNY